MAVDQQFSFNFFDSKIIKFLFSGIVNTLFGYSVYATLIYFNVAYLIALFIATVLGVIFNYFSFGTIVFRANNSWLSFGKFVFAYAVIYVINAAFLSILVNNFRLDPYWGQVICVPLSVLASWLLMNLWVYKKD